MLYIVTYATHSERYFEILKDHPEIIVLGWDETWEGFHNKVWATVEFCKTKNPDDIVCFVDGFDSIILGSNQEFLKKYKTFDKPLIMSEDMNSQYVLANFALDKFFGKCHNTRVNSGMYIGTCESIIEFWSNFPKMEDDQTFATKKCRTVDYLKIDTNHDLFYNYTTNDTHTIKGKRIIINEKGSPCVISAPVNQNMNQLLEKAGYQNLPEITINMRYRINSYYEKMQLEIIIIIIIFCFAYFVPNKSLAFKLSILVFCLYLEYVLFTKHLEVPFINKILYTLLDGLHIILFLFIIYLMFNLNCNIYKLLLLDTIFLISLFFYIKLKRNALTEMGNNLLGIKNRSWITPGERILYFSDASIQYEPPERPLDVSWMDGNRVFAAILAILNMYCLWNIYSKKTCTTKG